MFVLYAENNQMYVRKVQPVTSGSVNIYHVRFQFSADWNGLSRTAIFRAGTESRAVLLGDDNETVIPWEVLQKPDLRLYCGVYGTRNSHTVLPTIWADLGVILEGASLGKEAQPPTPELWEQALDRKADGLEYDGLNLSLLSGEKTLSTVEIAGGGGGGVIYRFGHGLKQKGLDVSVDAVSDFSGDNTLPMTAAGVQASVGNIEALLATI